MTKLQAKLAFKSVSDSSDIYWKIKKYSKSRAFSDSPPTAKSFWVPNYNALNFVSNPGLMLSMV